MAETPAGAIVWPHGVLRPLACEANKVVFDRSGGRTLAGLERVTRTDRGWWSIVYKGVPLGTPGERKSWNAIGVHMGGRVGLMAVPVWSFDSAAWPAGAVHGATLVPHSDGTTHSDGTYYSQPSILVQMAAAAALGATSVTLRAVHNIAELTGIRWSYNHALYETGFPTLIDGDEWTMPVFPAIRAAIPADAWLDVDLPTCLVHLATAREMDSMLSRGAHDRRDVAFVEATDYWNTLALA